MGKDLTYIEKTLIDGKAPIDRQNTKWARTITNKCKHNWHPVQFRMEIGDREMPDMAKGRVYCVCMKCCGHTYIETGYVGYYLGSPDTLEE